MDSILDKEFNALKILHHMDRLRALANGQDILPVTVEIDPVAYCNHRCEWCVDPAHYRHQLSESVFQPLIDELSTFRVRGFGVEGIVFKGGGEPTLHPQFDQMVSEAASRGFSVGTVTNGSRLTKWHTVLANHAAFVRVSIDGPTPESHRRIHQSNDFEQILAGVSELVKSRGTARHPIIGLSFAIDIHTVSLVPQALELGEHLGVNYVLVRPPFFEEVGSQPTMSISEAQAVRQVLQEAAAHYKGPLDVFVGNWVGDKEQALDQTKSGFSESGRRAFQPKHSLPIEHRTKQCLASPLLAVITADGTVYGCCNLRALSGWSFGKLEYSKGVSFQSIWQSAQRREKLSCMHKTECIQHCTHPLSRYNEMIAVLQDQEKYHSAFV